MNQIELIDMIAECNLADKTINLNEADLSGANLRGAILSGADLSGADLRMANLHGADLRMANLHGANLRGAILSGTILSGAILSGAILSGADLSVADLSVADLSGADLRMANLHGANLRGAILSGTILSGAKGIMVCGPIGSRGDMLYAIEWPETIMFKTGCFWGSHDEFVARIKEIHGSSHYAAEYLSAVEMAKFHFDNISGDDEKQ